MLVEGVTIVNAPMWQIHPVLCTNVIVRGVTVNSHGPNNDGCDPESCQDVLIEGRTFDTGDDSIALKSGRNDDGRRVNVPVENVVIRDCVMKDCHGGVVIGSEMSGGVRDVVVSDCTMTGTDRGIRIKTRRGRGGTVENLSVANVTMRTVGCPIVMHMYYRYTGLRTEEIPWVSSREPQPVDAGTPLIRGIHLRDVVADDVTGPCLVFLYGLPEQPIAEVSQAGRHLRHRAAPTLSSPSRR